MRSPDRLEEAYVEWKKRCIRQLLDDGYTEEDLSHVEICENGQVHFHRGSLYDITEPGYVTPWETFLAGR